MKVKVSEVTGRVLDWMVATAEGHDVAVSESGEICIRRNNVVDYFNPSTDWGWGGPIVDREKIGVTFHPEWEVPNWGAWVTEGDDHQEIMGETALIAAMRCFVASKLGHEVEVPNELLEAT